MTWPAPHIGDVVWCYFPYPDGPKRHPALILDVDTAAKPLQVIVSGGTSAQKGVVQRKHTASDLLIKKEDACFAATGLENSTLFHFKPDGVLRLVYDEQCFWPQPGGTPKIGKLNAKDPAVQMAVQRAAKSAQLSQTLEKLRTAPNGPKVLVSQRK
jgi:hypothetical protein